MSKKKEVILFTYGDANNAATWSNVPYYFANALEKKGFIVRKVNIKKFGLIQKIVNKTIKIFNKKTCMAFERTWISSKISKMVMKKAIRKYPDSICNIVTNFNISPGSMSNNKSIIFSDWTFEYLIEHFNNRRPGYFEEKEIQRQNKEIESSDYVISLFPQVCEYMKKRYTNNNIMYLGNVINMSMDEEQDHKNMERFSSDYILFIGRKKYIDSAENVAKALEVYNANAYKKVKLYIIGMNRNDLNYCNDYVKCFGYINKTQTESKNLYYDLILNSKCCINTSDVWAGFSSIVEMMYNYTPVITSKYSEFVKTFGEEIDFGIYCENKVKSIVGAIKYIENLDENEYEKMQIKAHNAVKGFSWDEYMDNIIESCNI